MGWVSLASSLLKLINVVMGIIQNKQLMDAGKAEAIVAGMQHVSAMVDDAAKGAAGMQFDPAWAERVRSKYRQP